LSNHKNIPCKVKSFAASIKTFLAMSNVYFMPFNMWEIPCHVTSKFIEQMEVENHTRIDP
jgi:hypothetical protein